MADALRRGHKASGKALAAHERQLQAVQLRKQGHTYQEIADKVGYAGPQGAQKSVLSALKKTLQEPTDELRTLECERLDEIIKAFWPIMLKGSTRHAEMILKAMDRRAAYLGLDAPKQVEDHRTVTISIMAEQLAQETGLNAAEIVAEAQAIVARVTSGIGN